MLDSRRMARRPLRIQVPPASDWLGLDEIGFLGRWVLSANRRWLLAHGSVRGRDPTQWSSDLPVGAALLFDHGVEAMRLTGLVRPETVAVSEAGVFAVYEWGRSDDFLGPACQLRAFTAQGRQLLKLQPGAVVDHPALSPNGRYLVFHTLAAPAESPRKSDGASLFALDLAGPLLLWQAPVPVRWPTGITFSPDGRTVLVHGEGTLTEVPLREGPGRPAAPTNG